MRREGTVLYKGIKAGMIWQDENGYWFEYDEQYRHSGNQPVSLTLPFQKQPYHSHTMLPFFDGLIPEGWLLDIAVKNWKLNPNDRMQLLLTICKDCLGAVSIESDNKYNV